MNSIKTTLGYSTSRYELNEQKSYVHRFTDATISNAIKFPKFLKQKSNVPG